jgi:hypothetical protein
MTTDDSGPLEYLVGFGNEHQSEALPGALPIGRRSPQRPAYGLYAEQLSGTSFTAPCTENLRSWLYRIRPSVTHGKYRLVANRFVRSGPVDEAPTPAAQLRWDPFPIPADAGDFVDGLRTLAANGNVRLQKGVGIHVYLADASMLDRFFCNADGELLIVPQQGRLRPGLRMFAASMAPSLLPAPTRVCISSMNSTISPFAAMTSFTTAFNRSSNSPLYLAPAIRAPISSEKSCFDFRFSGTSPRTIRCAKPSAMAVLPTPGSPIKIGLFLVRRDKI